MDLRCIQSDGAIHTVEITAAWEEVASDYEEVVAEFARATMTGNRRRRSPRSVIERRFGNDILEQTRQRAFNRLSHEALIRFRENGIGVVLNVFDGIFERESPVQFTIRIEWIESVSLPASHDLISRMALNRLGADGEQCRLAITRGILASGSCTLPESLLNAELPPNPIDPGEFRSHEERLRLLVFLNSLAKPWRVTLAAEELEAHIGGLAAEYAMCPKILARELQNGRGYYRLRAELLADKVMQVLMRAVRKDAARSRVGAKDQAAFHPED